MAMTGWIGPILIFMAMLILPAGPVDAKKPPWAGGHKDKIKHGKAERYEAKHHFNDHHHDEIHRYYAGHYGRGHCPPGLAKKHNGCMPPGQARKWFIGRPLPASVVFYNVPPGVISILGPPPPHHRYVRVAADILLIAVGTGMVVDAIENLSWEFGH